jgi:glycosyltransferase involved in cell wall biosynthesis
MISVIFPAYNEEENVKELHRRIKAVLSKMGKPFEIVAIENGSTDETLNELKKLSPVKIVVIAKNIGQTAGLDAGLKMAQGDVVVTMDADLQNDPDDIVRLVKKINEGYDVVSGWRKERKDTFGRRLLSRLANWLTYKVTGLHLHDSACALKAYRKEALQGVNLYGEMHVFLPAILHGRGARVAELPVKHHDRSAGVSKHNLLKAVKDIADLMVVKFTTDYMSRPFLFFGGWGAVSIALGVFSGGTSLVLKLLDVRNIGQTPLPILMVLFIVVGVLFIMMGFLAEIMLRTYYEAKGKTPYIIKDVIEK